jgi:hypothetical protein
MRTATLLFCIAGLLAAQDVPPRQNSEHVIRETFKFVLAPVTVTDKKVELIEGLTPYDFKLFDNGKLQKSTEDMAQHSLSIVVAIQANVDVEAILPSVKKLSSVFESLVIGEDGEMAVIAYDHRIQTLTGFTSDPAQIDAAFKKLTPGSYTAELNNATMAGINMLKTRPATRRRILVLIGENRDQGSDISVREVLTEADFCNR